MSSNGKLKGFFEAHELFQILEYSMVYSNVQSWSHSLPGSMCLGRVGTNFCKK